MFFSEPKKNDQEIYKLKKEMFPARELTSLVSYVKNMTFFIHTILPLYA